MASRKGAPAVSPVSVAYALEQLFADQDRDWVEDCIAPVLAWVPRSVSSQPYRFEVEQVCAGATKIYSVELTWDTSELGALMPGVVEHARRLQKGRSVQREHVTELAAYGLTLVAISLLMPGRRVVSMSMGVAPDMLFDVTPGHLQGVETAGRRTGGRSALMVVRNGTGPTARAATKVGKAASLLARADLSEVHLSLWSGSSRLGIMEQLKP